MLVAGFCLHGPYRYDMINLLSPDFKFISVGYQNRYINPSTLDRFKRGVFKNNDRVYVAMWDAGKSEKGVLLREGTIDFIKVYPDFVRFNVFLDPPHRRAKLELLVFPLGKLNDYLLREV